MRIAETNTMSAWNLEADAGVAGRARALRGRYAARRVREGSGGAAPARSVETGLVVRRSAEMGRRRAETRGAAQEQKHTPIWLAALAASRCQATRNGEDHAVRWDCISGRAVYTNAGAETETIQPLGVDLRGGQTLAVCWMPGETGYTLEVYGRNEVRA